MAQAATAKKSGGFDLTLLVMPVALIIGVSFWYIVCRAHTIELPNGHHEAMKTADGSADILGLIYMGGFIVPILLTMLFTVIAFTFERLLTLAKAKGTGDVDQFLATVKSNLASDNINGALDACTKQKGSVANVVQAGLHKYADMAKNTELETEQKVLNISKEIEEATALEMPSLQKNLSVLATIASVGTLVALLGTVIGMIKSFAALATSGTPDPGALSQGISEALVNTAIGIATSAFAIIVYNILTSKIDSLTYAIDEIGFSIAQTFAGHKK